MPYKPTTTLKNKLFARIQETEFRSQNGKIVKNDSLKAFYSEFWILTPWVAGSARVSEALKSKTVNSAPLVTQ